ncbi:hypothetical protein B0H66DRAFT_371913 [Apodospora peruviana]|uniref:Uncharacterized protein n=1 Tax=Apodospora peruviana TaxID=516989 RepID=A0AAE0M084_9PEZI|nr:hypothetical protein B0H66DRAFT_371913 [Apodospora peruviana]
MPLFDVRDILAFPGGDNSTDTLIGGVHLNLTRLEHWNYTLYSNGTLSNGSWCLLTFPPYQPALVLDNGTFVNVTWCWHPVNPIGARAGIGLGFAVAFAFGLLFTLLALTKHGKKHLPVERRFFPIGRRWQWYWACFTCATALISLLTNIDVDRYYLPELPIVLTSFFWFLMQIGTMAIIWEAVRHWGSWMERQFIDPNPFVLKIDDRRSKVEFWLPLVAYFWMWMNFFLIIPRNWGRIWLQRFPQQTIDEAIPAATDGRFKVAAFCLFIVWLITCFSLRHSIKHYRERNRGLLNRAMGIIRYTPVRFLVLIPLSLVIPAFQALVAWKFEYSPLNVKGMNAAIYAGGYAPSLLIVYIQALGGYLNPNEDLELQRQRHVRGEQLNDEMGIVRKPAWWRRLNDDYRPGEGVRDRIARNVRELGGGKPTARNLDAAIDARVEQNLQPTQNEDVEMDSIPPPRMDPHQAADLLGPVTPGNFAEARQRASQYGGKSDTRRMERTTAAVAGLLFPGANEGSAAAATSRHAELTMDGPPPYRGRQSDGHMQPPAMDRSVSADTTNSTNQPPQQIRSMLDV